MASRKSPRFVPQEPTHAERIVQHYIAVLECLKDSEDRVSTAISLYEYILQHWPNIQTQVNKEKLKSGMSEIEVELQGLHAVSLSKKVRLHMAFQTLRSLL